MQIDQTDSSAVASQARVLDAAGGPIQIWEYRGSANRVSPTVFLPRGLSEVFIVGENARTLVLEQDGEELQRIEVDLEPGKVNVIRP
ncbi:MAG: hypothetical protein GY711_14885 [bacterium]|nr:hypothetical protein [bacterium]